jgi:toxin ParE1/3/4
MALAIEKSVSRLKDFPLLGPSGRVVGTREIRVSRTPYLVAYRVDATAVTILRLINNKQQAF